MESPLWNVIQKGASAMACLLLLGSVALILAAQIGSADTLGSGVMTLVFAVVVSIAAIVLLNLSTLNSSRMEYLPVKAV